MSIIESAHHLQFGQLENATYEFIEKILCVQNQMPQIHRCLIISSDNNYITMISNFFSQFDAYTVPPTLRARNKSGVSSLITGALSLLLTLFFTYVFAIKMYQVFTYQSISSVKTQSIMNANQSFANQVIFGVRLNNFNSTFSKKLMRIFYRKLKNNQVIEQSNLVQCTQDQWVKLGDNYKQLFEVNYLSQFFCPPKPLSISGGNFFKRDSEFILIYFDVCTVDLINPVCLTLTQVQSKLQQTQFSIVNLYYLQQAIAEDEKVAIFNRVNTDIIFPFSSQKGLAGAAQISNIQVATDEGVWPIAQQATESGNYLYNYWYSNFQKNLISNYYGYIYVYVNERKIQIQREVGKVDQVLSYAGGLFSIVIAFFAFFLGSYNQYRYQLMAAEGLFNEDEKGNLVIQQKFGFFTYIKYSLYQWIGVILCCKPNWSDCVLFDKAMQEAKQQMDVTRLFRKIQNIEGSLNYIMNRNQKYFVALSKPKCLQKLRHQRQITQYYNVIVQNRQGIYSQTLQQYRLSKLGNNESLNLLSKRKLISIQDPSLQQIQLINYENSQKINSGQSLKDLKKKQDALSILSTNFPKIAKQAEKIKLDQEFQQIQKELSTLFLELEDQKRTVIQQTIPIIILMRLYRRKVKENQLNSYSNSATEKQQIFLVKKQPKPFKKSNSNRIFPK